MDKRQILAAWGCSLLCAACFVAVTLSLYHPIVWHGNQYDDAYITYRYAINVAEGHGLVYNVGERVNSASSLLYTVLLAAVYTCGAHNLERVGSIFGLICGAVLLILLHRILFHLTKHLWIATALVLPLAVSGSLSAWATSGMETLFYVFLEALFLWALLCGHKRTLSVSLAALLVTRPEAILFLAVWIGANGYIHGWRRALRQALFPLLVEGAVLLFYALYYGSLLPQPVVFKHIAVYYSPGLTAQYATVAGYYEDYYFLQLVLALGFAAFTLWRDRRNAGYCRYCVPSLPLLTVGAGIMTDRVIRHLFAAPQYASRLRIALALVCSLAVYQAAQEQMLLQTSFLIGTKHQRARKELGAWVAHNVPAEAVVMSSDIDAIGYVTKDTRFLDIFGLVSKAPFQAAQSGHWDRFAEKLRTDGPAYFADTGFENGDLQSLRVLVHPWLFFKSVPRPHFAPHRKHLFYELHPAIRLPVRQYIFEAGRVDWKPAS